MLEGVDRLVDLVGTRSAGLTGASRCGGAEWTARCEATLLATTDGHFAAVGRDGKTVRLARTIGIPLRYFVAKMYHGPFLVVADRMDRIFEWCQEQRIAWQFEPAYTRMVPAHYIVELDQVGCPDPAPRYRRFFDPPVGRGSTDLQWPVQRTSPPRLRALKHWIAGVPERRADCRRVLRRRRQHRGAAAGKTCLPRARSQSGSDQGVHARLRWRRRRGSGRTRRATSSVSHRAGNESVPLQTSTISRPRSG